MMKRGAKHIPLNLPAAPVEIRIYILQTAYLTIMDSLWVVEVVWFMCDNGQFLVSDHFKLFWGNFV